MAAVMQLPSAAASGVVELARRRLRGTYAVDEWGLDHDLVGLLDPLLPLRWDVEVDGADRLPADGPALVVYNRRFGWSEPMVVAHGLRRETGRTVRPAVAADLAPAGPVLRRLGAVLSVPSEWTSLLRAGEVVVVGLDRQLSSRRRAGELDPEALTPAVTVGAPVVPVATLGWEIGRRWRLVVGHPLVAADGGLLAGAELADAAHRAVQDLLDGTVPPRRFVER